MCRVWQDVTDLSQYSRLPLNPYLSVDTPGYGLSGSMGLKDGPKNRSQKIMKKSRKNQFCIFEACEAILGANARVEICTSNNVKLYKSKVTIFHLYKIIWGLWPMKF